ncbi:hypothetical protein QYF61_022771 [Mycteria americana]|uniref:Uncharacterized protein n=1 Tax=Mycteria americana TaxID=33587 RepID=A0AAN7NTC8_MYCAM|nr:hypothetical protein QYF61_022771 [Mycteria americana]
MLTGPDHLVVLYVPHDGTQDDLLRSLPQHRGQTDRPIVPWILLLALLVDGRHICEPPINGDLPNCPAFLDSALQDFLLRDSVNQSPKQAKVCPPEVQESQNRIGWKRPLRSSSPTVNLTLPRPPLHHVPKHLIQTSFKYLQGWRLNHFPGQPGPMLDNPFTEVKFPNIQSKPPLQQLEAISSRPMACYLGEETDPHLSTTSFQVVVESNKVSPQPPFLQAKQPQFPQPLPIRLVLQTLHQLRCPSLDTLQHLNVSVVGRGPKLNTVFEVWPHQCRVQGHDHFPSPAGHTIFDTSQDAIGFLGHLGTLLAHIRAAVNQHPQVLLCRAAFQPLFPKPVALHGVAVAQVQDLALGLVEPHTTDLGPSIQPVQVPLQSLPTLKQINNPAQLGVICKLTEGALDPLVKIIDKDIKQNWPQHRALGNTTCDRQSCDTVQDGALPLVELHEVPVRPFLQPAQVPLDGSMILWCISYFAQFCVISKLAEGTLCPIIHIINEDFFSHYFCLLLTKVTRAV